MIIPEVDSLDELNKKKLDLQAAIFSNVRKLVEQFKYETGVSPTDIQISMVHIADRLTLFDRIPEYVVGKVSLTL